MAKRTKVFERKYDGPEVLEQLLSAAGAVLDVEGVSARFRQAQANKADSGDVVPTLFETEPRFGDPEMARRLFQNLLGLWDALARGEPAASLPGKRPKRQKPTAPQAPPPLGMAEPDDAWVALATQYLRALGTR